MLQKIYNFTKKFFSNMNFKETDLPGIGKKYTINLSSGKEVAIILHFSGKREVFYFDNPDDDPQFHFVLNEEETKLVASILMGSYFKPEQEQQKDLLMGKLSIEWVTVDKTCSLVGKSILQSQIRKLTGVTIIAIIRNLDTIINPPPEEIIQAKDTLVVVGNREQTKFFNKKFEING